MVMILSLVIGIVSALHSNGSSAPAERFLAVEVLPIAVASIPRGAQRVELLRLRFAASCAGDVLLRGIRLHHGGAGDPRDILRVYAVEGERRLTRGRAFSTRQGELHLPLRAFTVPSCAQRTIAFLADLAPDAAASGEHGLVLESDDAIDTVGASVLVERDGTRGEGEWVRIAGDTRGSIAVTSLPLPRRLSYGSARVLARFLLRAEGDNLRVHAITVVNGGKARGMDITDLWIESGGGDRLSAVLSALQDDRARFVLEPPLLLPENRTRVIEVRGSVRAGRRRTVEFTIEESSDIESDPVRGR